jgi:GNAT superfamily N-acetyltransferase
LVAEATATRCRLELGAPTDAPEIAALQTAVANDLTARYGKGHWSLAVSERGVLFHMRTGRVYVLRSGSRDRVIATLRLCTKKPWAIDPKYFMPCKRPLYLLDMAVAPALQRQGIGRLCVEGARGIGKEWPADAIRLDSYDAAAGAGEFYRKCGFTEVGRVIYKNTPLVYFERLLSLRGG